MLQIFCVINTSIMGEGRNEVRWRPRLEASLAPPCSNLSSFESKCTVLKKVLVTLLGLFGVPAPIQRHCSDLVPPSDSAPGELRPHFTPSLRPCYGDTMRHWFLLKIWGPPNNCASGPLKASSGTDRPPYDVDFTAKGR